jgi:ABC-type bacteriocin/lantibiotic exporters, contain an N-terminal double-glycine peptidase domain
MGNEASASQPERRLSLGRLMSNVRYLVSQAYEMDRPLVILVFSAFVFVTTGYGLLDTFLFKRLVDSLTSPSISFSQVAVLVACIAGIAFAVQFMDAFAQNFAGARFVKLTGRMQESFIRKAAAIDLECYDNSRYFDDFVIAASQADEMISTGIFAVARILGNVAGILTSGIFILTINPIVAIIPIVGFAVNIVTRFAITKTEYDYDMERRRIMRRADYSRRVFYQPEYAKEIKLSSIDMPLRRQFNGAIDEIEEKARKAGVKIAALSLVNWIIVFTCLSFFVAPLYLAYLVLVKKSLSFGGLASMDSAQGNVRNQLDAMNYALVDFQRVGQFAERFRRFMDYEARIEGAPGLARPPAAAAGREALLEIDHLSFRYEGAANETLRDISMTVRPGERIAIVGENGAGKSTFIKLLMRLYDPTGGAIRYGGHDIRDFATEDYRRLFGAVFQDYQLYGASLAENVLMAERASEDRAGENRQAQDERLRRALALADFERKLSRLPRGLDTEMTREFSDEGTMLSGGESQKVAIARMFARDSRGLEPSGMALAILDEPSSALDPHAEHVLNRNMLAEAGAAAVIFISHRLSTTRDADRIYLFESGRIAEEGTHDELMRLGGVYAAMFDKQAHYYQEEA